MGVNSGELLGETYLPETLQVVNYFVNRNHRYPLEVYEEDGTESGFEVDTSHLFSTVRTVGEFFHYMGVDDDSRPEPGPEVVRLFATLEGQQSRSELGTFVMRTGREVMVENIGHLEGQPQYLAKGWLVKPSFVERELHPQVTVVTPGGKQRYMGTVPVPAARIGSRGILLDKKPIFCALRALGSVRGRPVRYQEHLYYPTEEHHTIQLREILSRAALDAIQAEANE